MNVKFLRRTSVAATLILLPCSALAQDSAPALKPRAQLIQQFDSNHDGKLDRAERKAAREARKEKAQQMRERRDSFDTDADGRLNDAEFAAFDAANRQEMEKRPRAMARFDQDKDGKLNDAEWAAARQTLKERGKRGSETAKP